jgi:hypothetical protein
MHGEIEELGGIDLRAARRLLLRLRRDVKIGAKGARLGLVVQAHDAAGVAPRSRRLAGGARTDKQQRGKLCEELLQTCIGQAGDVVGGNNDGAENGNLHWPQSGGLNWPHPVMVDVSV